MKCKVFETESYNLQEEVNEWLEKGKYEIVNVAQTQHEEYITLTIFYLTEKELRAKKLNKLNDYETEN